MSNERRDDYVDISSSATSNRSSRKKSKKMSKKTLTIKIVSGLLSILIMVLGIFVITKAGGVFGVYKDLDDIPNVNVTQNASGDGDNTATEPDLLMLDSESGNLLSDPYVLNIMLFGADQYGNQGLSDTMILLSIDNRHKAIKMTSFLRDTYISIPGYYASKLNAAYALGGAALSIATIESNYGIKIDRYAIVNFATFKDIVNIMGGVEVELTQQEIYYINDQIAWNNQSEYLPADTQPGMVTLNGQQALWYARNRGGYVNGTVYGGSDWDRVERQRKFLNAIIDKMKKEANLVEIIQIVNAVGPNVTTNIKNSELTTLVSGALTYLNYDIEQLSMPSDGRWSYGYNEAGSVILVDDWYGARMDLAKFVYEDLVAQ